MVQSMVCSIGVTEPRRNKQVKRFENEIYNYILYLHVLDYLQYIKIYNLTNWEFDKNRLTERTMIL